MEKTAIWSLAARTPEVEEIFEGQGAIWSPDGSMLAVARQGGIWDALSGQQFANFAGGVAWAPNSKKIAVGCPDGIIRTYEVDMTGIRPERVLRGHTSEIWSVSWSSDGQWLASCGLRDETVRIWKANERNQIRSIGETGEYYAPKLSEDGNRLIASGHFGTIIRVWDRDGNMLIERNIGEGISRAIPNADGTTVAIATLAEKVFLWDLKTDELTTVFSERLVFNLAWSKDDRLAAITNAGDILIWDEDLNLVREILGAHDGGRNVQWSPNGRCIASSGGGLSIKMWDARTGVALWQVSDLPRYPNTIRFNHVGNRLVSGHRNSLMIWDADDGEAVAKFGHIQENFVSLDWSPDDKRLVTGSSASVTIWDVDSGRVALRLDGPGGLASVQWASDGMRIVAGGEGIIVYDASRGYARK